VAACRRAGSAVNRNLPRSLVAAGWPGVVHDEFTGDTPARILAVFTVEKGKALTSMAD